MFQTPFPESLSSNGPIVHNPFPQLESPLPLPPDRRSSVEDDGRADNPQSAIPNPQSEIPHPGTHPDSLNPEPRPLNPEPGHHPKDGPLNPPRPGRPKALDEDKKATVCALLAAGVSLRQAGRFVDCDPNSIRREARRNREFRRQLAKARSEASVHPLQTLRQAAKTNWRAALCWMERLDPERFARPDASVVTQRESNRFLADLIQSVELAVSNLNERNNLFELLSAAMPAAMRRRWDGHRVRRHIQQTLRLYDETKIAERQRQDAERRERDKRRDELFHEIARYLPDHLYGKLGRNFDLLDPEEVFAQRPPASAERACAGEAPQNDRTNGSATTDDRSTDECAGATGSASVLMPGPCGWSPQSDVPA